MLSAIVAEYTGWPHILRRLWPELVGEIAPSDDPWLRREFFVLCADLAEAGDADGMRAVWELAQVWYVQEFGKGAIEKDGIAGAVNAVLESVSSQRCPQESVMLALLDFGASRSRALVLACRWNLVAVMQRAIDGGAYLSREALYTAAAAGHRAALRLLLDYKDGRLAYTRGARGNIDEIALSDSLAAAARGGYDGAVQLLLERGAPRSSLALVEGARGGNPKIVKALLGALLGDGQANNYAPDSVNCALVAAAGTDSVRAMRVLVDYGANQFNDALAVAADNGRIQAVQFLLNDCVARPADRPDYTEADVRRMMQERRERKNTNLLRCEQ